MESLDSTSHFGKSEYNNLRNCFEQNSDTVTFIVEAEGDGLTYQWPCRAPGASSFEHSTGSNATSSTLRVEMTAESNDAPLNTTYNGTVYYIIDPFCPLFYTCQEDSEKGVISVLSPLR